MGVGHWLLGLVIVLGTVAALYGLVRFCLRRKYGDWPSHRKNTLGGGQMSAFLRLQQYIEPRIKYVLKAKHQDRSMEDRERVQERLLARLLACLESNPVNREEIRCHLATALRAGLVGSQLYEKVVAMQRTNRPEDAARFPGLEEVVPWEG